MDRGTARGIAEGRQKESHPLELQQKAPNFVRVLYQPNGPAEMQCEFFGPNSGLNFGR